MKIKNFIDCPDDLPTIATWLIEEFFADKPQYTVENMVARMKGGQRKAVPLGLASFKGRELTGTVSLLAQDLGRSSELSPWVAGLYVRPEYRKKGIGASLINAVVAEAQGMEYRSLYLYTEIPSFYENLKWQIHSEVQDDKGVYIMSRLLAN